MLLCHGEGRQPVLVTGLLGGPGALLLSLGRLLVLFQRCGIPFPICANLKPPLLYSVTGRDSRGRQILKPATVGKMLRASPIVSIFFPNFIICQLSRYGEVKKRTIFKSTSFLLPKRGHFYSLNRFAFLTVSRLYVSPFEH